MIRATTEHDLPAIWNLMNVLEDEVFPFEPFASAFQAVLENPYMFAFVYEEQGKVVGCLNMRIDVQLHHSGLIAEINDLVVDPECRSKGYGAALIDFAEAFAIDKGALQFELTTNQKRARAHAFYRSHGFEATHYKFVKQL